MENRAVPKDKKKTRRMVLTALFATIVCVATLVIRIPTPLGGYFHMGDTTILLAGFLLGPAAGATAGAVGSVLADFFGGYVQYVPPTLIIKGLMGYLAGLLYRRLGGNGGVREAHLGAAVLAGLVCESVMVVGYYLFALIFLRFEGAAALTIPGDVVQGLVGIVGATLLLKAFSKSSLSI
ncbi:MAG: ECF transporter S component [Clostridiales bacterium]|nr:ECF transporter S component [Clostridiales bacterium]